MTLRSATIRLAHSNPGLRQYLLPVLCNRGLEARNQRETEKDDMRISDMEAKARDQAHFRQLAQNMAKAIKDADKAEGRGDAAANQNFHDIAQIFYDRAEELR